MLKGIENFVHEEVSKSTCCQSGVDKNVMVNFKPGEYMRKMF